MAKGSRKKLKFEEAVAELESIIERIESGETGLEDSLAAYEQGMKLIGQCRGILATVKKRIAELSVDREGNVTGVPGDDPDEGAGEAGG